MRTTLRAPSALLILATLVLSSGFAAVGPAEAADEPGLVHITNWNIGDFWSYKKEPGPGDGTNTRGTWAFRVQGVEQVELQQWSKKPYWSHTDDMRRHTTFRVETWLNQSVDSGTGPLFIRSHMQNHYRTDDLGFAWQDALSTFTYTETGVVSSQDRINEYFPPKVTTFFPFAVGDKWQVDSMKLAMVKDCSAEPEGSPCDHIQERQLHVYEVKGQEPIEITVNGKARTFDAYVIKIDEMMKWDDATRPEEKRYYIWWYVPEVCRFVREDYFSSSGLLMWRITLDGYKCSQRKTPDPPYRDSLYSFDNLSSTRLDGRLAPKSKLQEFEDLARGEASGGGGGFQLGNLAPGFELVAALGALLALAAYAQRRRR